MAETLQITSEGIKWIDVCNPSNAEVIELRKEYKVINLTLSFLLSTPMQQSLVLPGVIFLIQL